MVKLAGGTMFWFKNKVGEEGSLVSKGNGTPKINEVSRDTEFKQIIYPPADTLEVAKSEPEYVCGHFRLLEILSENIIGLVQIGNCMSYDFEVRIGESVEAVINFHDGSSFEFVGEIVSYSCNLHTRNHKLICVLNEHIPIELISKEIAYLKDNYGVENEQDSQVENESYHYQEIL